MAKLRRRRKENRKSGPKGGRPTKYSEAIANDICEWLSEGLSLRAFCRQEGRPRYGTIMKWLYRKSVYRDIFIDKYQRAREMQAECLVDDILDIADDSDKDIGTKKDKKGNIVEVLDLENVQRSKLRIETRKWIASKMVPTKYGDNSSLKLSGERGGPVIFKVIYENRLKDKQKC